MVKAGIETEKIVQVFDDYCKGKKYQVTIKKDQSDDYRLDISNLKDRANIMIYHTGSIVIGGSQNPLKAEIETLKKDFEKDPTKFMTVQVPENKACAMRYDIMLPELRVLVKVNLKSILDVKSVVTENPKTNVEYTAKVQRNSFSVTITQFSNGTLLLQGKNDALFSECCDLVETQSSPSEKDVVSRFISGNEESLKVFAAKYTPELIELAEKKTKDQLGVIYDYLEPYDQKWFVASECLALTEIPLPEYSPIVMPASKAFEGFSKKLLISIGLFPTDHFKNKTANFSNLSDTNNPSRKTICDKDKYADTMLKKLASCIDTNRNFMLHSDDAKVTKIESIKEAREKLNIIIVETKEIFKYFNDIYHMV